MNRFSSPGTLSRRPILAIFELEHCVESIMPCLQRRHARNSRHDEASRKLNFSIEGKTLRRPLCQKFWTARETFEISGGGHLRYSTELEPTVCQLDVGIAVTKV